MSGELALSLRIACYPGEGGMMSTDMLLSIVCPAFNEEDGLSAFHRELLDVLEALNEPSHFEILYVDDGSTDGTLELLRQLACGDQRVKYVSLSRNFGQQAALTAGIQHAAGDVVITMDADMQHPPDVIPQLLDEWKRGAQIVNTVRGVDMRLSRFKRWTSKCFYRMMRTISNTEVVEGVADFRLMTRPAVSAFLRMGESHRFVRGMVQWLGFRCATIRYTPNARIAGRSSYTLRSMIGLALTGMLSFSKTPLRLPIYLGLILALAGVGCSLWLTVGVILGTLANPLLWLILAGMNLIGGVTLLSLGIIGEYVSRIHDEVKGRPLYLLKETGNLQSTVCESVPEGVEALVAGDRWAA
jgi:polyisoprenyl-phosphate glycosyltransferase